MLANSPKLARVYLSALMLVTLIVALVTGRKTHRRATIHQFMPQIYNESLRTVHHRIAGGMSAKEGDFPSFVGLSSFHGNMGFGCGGTMISERLIITAAHCALPHHTVIAAPSIWHQQLWSKKRVRTYKVDKRCPHPDYSYTRSNSQDKDIAILRLEEPIPGIRFALLPSRPVPINFKGVTVGLGTVDSTNGVNTPPESLQALPMRRKECQPVYSPHWMCADAYQSPWIGSICAGDSGSALYGYTQKRRELVVGVVVRGGVPCKAGHLGTSIFVEIWPEVEEIQEISRRCLED